jgi:DNA-binding winged helix-turn-helix (wHTH) protein/predicted ATPase
MKPEPAICFPPFCLDLPNQQLWRGKKKIFLRQKTFAMLRYLLDHAGQLVTKDELLNVLWPDVYVTDMAPMMCIRELRKALRDNARQPRFIETLHRRGYRFIGKVVSSQQAAVRREEENQKASEENRSPAPLLIGRDAELAQLQSLLTKAVNGERQLVFVTGEAGIGKTAFIDTFLLRARDWGLGTGASSTQTSSIQPPTPNLWIGRGQCIEQFGAGEAYLPVLSAFGQFCREPQRHQLATILAQYAPTWLAQMPALLTAAEFKVPQPTIQGATRERMLREVAEALEALTVETALILILEDLQWSDHSTLELLSFLARRRQPARLLVIGTYRPVEELGHDHPLRAVTQDLQIRRLNEEISLPLLREPDVMAYTLQRLAAGAHRRTFFQPLVQEIYRRTEGNPLFMVNMLDHLIRQGLLVPTVDGWMVKSGTATLTDGIPQTLRTMIEQQFEQLSPEDQRVLEVASVAGMEFSASTVAAGVETPFEEIEQRCEELARHQHFLKPCGTIEWPDGTVAAGYTFIHALYQNVFYARVTAGWGVALHKRLGEREEQAYGSQAKEIAAKLAVHFERGRDYQRAVEYLQQAGANATRRSAYAEAINLLTKGVELLQHLPDTPERTQHELKLQTSLGMALMATKGYAAPEVEKAFARARELCRQVGEAPLLFRTLAGLTGVYMVRGALPMAHELAEQLFSLAQKIRDPISLVVAHHHLGQTLAYLGDLVSASAHLEQGISLYDPQKDAALASRGGNNPGVNCLSIAAYVLWLCGYPDQSLKRRNEALALARELSHPFSLAYALGWTAWVHRFRRERQAAQTQAEEVITLATEQGFPLWIADLGVLKGWGLAEQGQREEGLALMRESIAAVRATGAEIGCPHYLMLLAEAYGKDGQIEKGLSALDEARDIVNHTQECWLEAERYRLKGTLTLQRANQKAKVKNQNLPSPRLLAPSTQAAVEQGAEECFLKAIEIARRQQAKSLELRAVMSLVRLRQHRVRDHAPHTTQPDSRTAQPETRAGLDEAHNMLVGIYNWFTEGLDTQDLQEAKALLEELRQ